MEIEEKIKEDVKRSIETKKKDAISPSLVNKWLFSFAPQLQGKMRISIMLACFGESLKFTSYFFAAYVATAVITNHIDLQKIYLYGGLTLLALALQCTLTCLSSVKSHRISFEILRSIREKLSEKLERVPLGYVTSTPIGYYKALIVDRVGSLEDWIAHVMPELPSRLLHPILATILLFVVDYRLGLACFVSVPFIILGFILMYHNSEERMYTWLNSNQDLNARIIEYVNGIHVIKTFGQSRRSYQKFTDSVNYYFSSTLDWWKQSWIAMAILFAFVNSPILGTLPVGLYLYSQQIINMWQLMLGLILPLSIIPNAFQIMMSMEIYSSIETGFRMIRKVLTMPELVRPNQEVSLSDQCYRFENVSFSYEKGIEVLHDINFEVKPNSVLAIVGESGSGKSTIAKLMAGFFDADAGTIYFGDQDVKNIPTAQLMKRVAYVAQDNFLFDTSIRENLKIAKADATDEEIQAALKAANCLELIERLPEGLNSNAGDCGKFLSGGERQRITLARAMLADAQCIILDEATAYADVENEAKIQEALSRLMKDKTLIVVAHRLNTIVGADQIMVLGHGKIESIGTHKELIQNSSAYQKLWQSYSGKEVVE